MLALLKVRRPREIGGGISVALVSLVVGFSSWDRKAAKLVSDVSVTFADPETALKAIGNRIDVLAAIGLGHISVTGLIPLADALGYIFERIPLYLEP